MAILKTHGIVLRASKFRDTSLITTLLTADYGKLKTLSKGVRKEGSQLTTHFEPFAHVDMVYYEKTKSDIHLLTETSLIHYFPKIRSSFEAIAWTSFLLELIDAVMPLHEKCEHLFFLFLDVLQAMEREKPGTVAAVFEIKLMAESGVFPSLAECARCSKKNGGGYLSFREGCLFCASCRSQNDEYLPVSQQAVETIGHFAGLDITRCLEIIPARQVENELHQLIYRWVHYRLEKDLVTFRFLREVELVGSSRGFTSVAQST